MKKSQFKLLLRPLHCGSFSQLCLFGNAVTMPSPRTLGRLMGQLSLWSSAPVEFVLPVDVGTAKWFESWSYTISTIPAHHLEVRFVFHRHHAQGSRDAV